MTFRLKRKSGEWASQKARREHSSTFAHVALSSDDDNGVLTIQTSGLIKPGADAENVSKSPRDAPTAFNNDKVREILGMFDGGTPERSSSGSKKSKTPMSSSTPAAHPWGGDHKDHGKDHSNEGSISQVDSFKSSKKGKKTKSPLHTPTAAPANPFASTGSNSTSISTPSPATSTKYHTRERSRDLSNDAAVVSPVQFQIEDSSEEEKAPEDLIAFDGQRQVLQEGTLRSVIDWLLREGGDAQTLQYFLLAHGNVISTDDLLHALTSMLEKTVEPKSGRIDPTNLGTILLNRLVLLGFNEKTATKALFKAHNSLEKAIGFLLDQLQSEIQPSSTALTNLTSQGFSQKRSSQALRFVENDLSRAVNLLAILERNTDGTDSSTDLDSERTLDRSTSSAKSGGSASSGSTFSAPDALQVQMRIANFLKTWLSMNFQELTGEERSYSRLVYLLNRFKSINPGLHDHIEAYMKAREKKIKGFQPQDHLAAAPEAFAPPPKEEYTLLDLNPLEVARQICLIDYQFLQSISLKEFLHTAWTTSNEAPALSTAMTYTNKLTYYFAYAILKEADVKERLKVWCHIAKIGKCLLEYHDFNAALSVFLALNNQHVEKAFRAFKKEVPKKSSKDFDELSEAMSPKSNFMAYRSLLKQIHGPHIPCYEVHLKDLLYMTDGNDDWIDKATEILNVYKIDGIGKIIAHFQTAALTPFVFTVEPATYTAISVPGYNAVELQALLDQIASPSNSTVNLTSSNESKALPKLSIDWTKSPSDFSSKEDFLRSVEEQLKAHQALVEARERDLDEREKALAERKKRRKSDFKSSNSSVSKSGSTTPPLSPPKKDANKVHQIMMVGLPGVGRSALLQRFSTNTFVNQGRSKGDETSPIIDVNGIKIQLLNPLLDIDANFDSTRYINQMSGIIAVFDMTDLTTFSDLTYWLQRSAILPNMKLFIASNRCDESSSREVSLEKARGAAQSLSAQYAEVSCKSGAGVRPALEAFVDAIAKN